MPEKDIDLLVIGELCVDLILSGGDLRPRFGQAEQLVEDATLALGSSAAILACGAARLGLRVAFSSLLGEDTFGRFVQAEMRARDVDLAGLKVDPAEKTGVTVHLSLPDDRAMLTYPGSMSHFSADQVPVELVKRARHVHVSSFFLQPGLAPGLPDLFSQARAGGASTSLDTGWDPLNEWSGGLQKVLQQTDIFLPNEGEAQAISGRNNKQDALRVLGEHIPLVVIKQGARGATALQQGMEFHHPAYAVTPVNTTGAGDNFNAGFLFAWLNGYPVTECLRWGSACGAMATGAVGGLGGQALASGVKAWMANHSYSQ